jgi:2-oxoglutarate dehydrogenase E2 component (dihydrolipoamide succinyltransferase)
LKGAIMDVRMPQMGEGIAEATLVKWLKKPGDKIAKDEPLLQVSTDKVDTEIPAPAEGILSEVLIGEGRTVAVNEVIARINGSASTSTKPANAPATSPERQTASPQVAKLASVEPSAQRSAQSSDQPLLRDDVRRSSPLVRKMAKDLGVNLSQIKGTGLNGRITKDDLLSPSSPSSTAVATAAPRSHRLKTATNSGVETLEGVPVRREKMTRIRKLIADHMVESVRTSPHVTTVFEIDLHKVTQIREAERRQFEKKEGFKLTFTPFLIHAAVQAIKDHPIVNVSVDGDEILWKDQINLGVAVALGEGGLIVPVIKDAGTLNLLGIARKLNDLATRARSKKLQPDEVVGGTFSITNPGGWGSVTSNPIINQPQVAILGIGAIIKRPVVIDDMIAIRPLMWASLTFDHRVIDGEGGSKWLASYKRYLENYEERPV